MKKNTKIILAVLILAIAALAGYFYLSSGEEVEPAPAVDPTISRELITTLDKLQAIKLDTSFFNRNDYRVLVDNTLVIQSRPVGRNNPFLPPENIQIEVIRNEDITALLVNEQNSPEPEEEPLEEEETTESSEDELVSDE